MDAENFNFAPNFLQNRRFSGTANGRKNFQQEKDFPTIFRQLKIYTDERLPRPLPASPNQLLLEAMNSSSRLEASFSLGAGGAADIDDERARCP